MRKDYLQPATSVKAGGVRTSILAGSNMKPDGQVRPQGTDATPIGGKVDEFDARRRLSTVE